MNRVVLSYPLSVNTPVYKDNPPVRIWPQTLIENGSPYNQYVIQTINHNGTHIDAPRHFNPQGKTLSEIPLDYFVFNRVSVIDVPKREDELITAADLMPWADRIAGSDLLLIRTGFGRIRGSDPLRYGNRNPGFAASAARFLMAFDSLRAIGVDFISAAAAQKPEEGILFHQIMLGKGRKDGRFILIMEDLNLNRDLSQIRTVYAVPWFIEGVDSSQATIFGEKR
ncbi:cyclase family protein [Cohnella sp. CFH 77786]|uniref:cyclase family protein n=1 Tax=Cohnella sp. CFH 77786 TaxID=2662265 RepID=UPI001C610F19|nr:cyclase family protein [Cohnella sp. CFH 77786]MBW5447954.1 cyclase family protein [Cohnella sp. CFH 77786]